MYKQITQWGRSWRQTWCFFNRKQKKNTSFYNSELWTVACKRSTSHRPATLPDSVSTPPAARYHIPQFRYSLTRVSLVIVKRLRCNRSAGARRFYYSRHAGSLDLPLPARWNRRKTDGAQTGRYPTAAGASTGQPHRQCARFMVAGSTKLSPAK